MVTAHKFTPISQILISSSQTLEHNHHSV